MIVLIESLILISSDDMIKKWGIFISKKMLSILLFDVSDESEGSNLI